VVELISLGKNLACFSDNLPETSRCSKMEFSPNLSIGHSIVEKLRQSIFHVSNVKYSGLGALEGISEERSLKLGGQRESRVYLTCE
tara:strand:+ start:2098 stop:2355 length:258 start_codon:yes stop_codon:yes gene_type:complete